MTAKRIARDGLLLAFALTVGWVETLLPVIPTVPGAKLGLANLVFLLLIRRRERFDAILLGGLRILLSAILFGGWLAALYSVGGAILAFCSMILLDHTEKFSPIGLSAAGAFFHNLGQTAVAMLLLGTKAVLYYLPYLLFVGTLCGVLVGFLLVLTEKLFQRKQIK